MRYPVQPFEAIRLFRPTLTGSIDCSIVEHEQFQRMSVVVARTLQVESNTLNMLGTQENMDRVEYLNITYGQSSAKLPVTQSISQSVTRSLRHLVTQSLGYSVTWSLGHSVTWSLGHLVTQSLGHSVTRSLGHLVTWSLSHLVTRSFSHLVTQ